MGRAGKLDINIDSVRLVDGEKVPLRAVKDMQGGGHVGAMTGAIVATSLVFFPAAPFFLFMHGKDISIPKGTEVTAYVNGNTPLEMAKFQGSKPDAVAAVAPELQKSTLDISSNPAGAEITIDGKFMGNTPSSLAACGRSRDQDGKRWLRHLGAHHCSQRERRSVRRSALDAEVGIARPILEPVEDGALLLQS